MHLRRNVVPIAVFTTLAIATSSLAGPSLVSIGALAPASGGTTESKVYALSPDGAYAVGASNGQTVAGTITISQAIIYSSASGLVQIPNNPAPDPELPTSARGVVVMGNGDVVAAGYYDAPTFASYRMASYRAAPGSLTTGTWTIAPNSSQPNLTVGTYNAARPYDDGTGLQWSIAGQRSNGNRGVISLPTANTFSDSGALAGFNRVYNVTSRVPAGTNRTYAAGYEQNTTTTLRRALFGIGNSTQTVVPGSAGYQSEALGMSPQTTNVANTGIIVGYDQDTTASHFSHAFYYTQGAAGMTLLSELAGDNQSQGIDARIFSGLRLIGGFSSDGTTEHAVLWDSSGIWDNTGTPKLLSSLLSGLGVDVSGWSSLSRVTSMSDDGKTVAGWGVWAADGSTRGFVATIVPEPSTIGLMMLGGLALVKRRRA